MMEDDCVLFEGRFSDCDCRIRHAEVLGAEIPAGWSTP